MTHRDPLYVGDEWDRWVEEMQAEFEELMATPPRPCICADPENCTEPVAGCRRPSPCNARVHGVKP